MGCETLHTLKNAINRGFFLSVVEHSKHWCRIAGESACISVTSSGPVKFATSNQSHFVVVNQLGFVLIKICCVYEMTHFFSPFDISPLSFSISLRTRWNTSETFWKNCKCSNDVSMQVDLWPSLLDCSLPRSRGRRPSSRLRASSRPPRRPADRPEDRSCYPLVR